MPNTITTFTDFTPGTKARANEVDQNFSNFRGHKIPINENTASASDNTHDLGTDEHRWRTGYFGTSLNLDGVTSTADIITQRTSDTTGGYEVLAGSATITSCKPGAFGFQMLTSTEYLKFNSPSAGALDLLMGSTTIGSWNANGMRHRSKAPMEFTNTGSAGFGIGIFTDRTTTSFNCDTTGSVTIGSFRLNTRGGGIVRIELNNSLFYATGTFASYSLSFRRGTTTTAMTILASWGFTTSVNAGTTVTANIISSGNNTIVLPYLSTLDQSYTAGEVVYEVLLTGDTGSDFACTGIAKTSIFIQEL